MTGFFFASCNKTASWQCTCTKDGDIVYKTIAHDAKKKNEKAACDKMEQEITGAKCELSKN
ncbi:MAG: hypothetical protein BGO31_16870 [Bacteroidetes bacterium 43-16]|nr:MAG: hypothetical protein BGO31_16870 [Bacteroidetes bacterium 43-16]